MDSITSNRIDDLLLNSDVFSNTTKENIIQHNFSNDTILITGAAGSIGSELAKQLINSSFKKLILVDIAESPLYNLIKVLEKENNKNVDFVILNITDKTSLEIVFKKYKPTLIFHAAAYKHVPLMESNPIEAVKLNIFGTKLLTDFSIKFKVKKFVFISTDKAVNPISVMGLTKLIAEQYLKFVSKENKVAFFITRFGNVLGSNGSVVPVLKKQLDYNSPITITSKEISRYFIAKNKACQLILHIAETENVSNTFTFKMGEPIKIIDLAKRMLFLEKRKENYPIIFTGLRPGEKLHEEMTSNSEELIASNHPDIFIVKNTSEHFDYEKFLNLINLNTESTTEEIKTILKNLV
ncbi:polysaccharide biosynthesis protein [Tamlana sp. 62-3]|uniref:Polysaccharide biosynthesis protein n=1 Tax=Neotamlana sargassicola TaxID=2883125 RepID=A0A9X1I644_9FLAO|nr:SDR family NAD(P)-dependent oxidoreductase [Tamlana sargassicola]MCB4808541.1 polysaccharide biosynthesis protein [Tamlana sargassicola]